MTPCGISWCVALTDKQFCSIHEKNQALHPTEIDPEIEAEESNRCILYGRLQRR
jgi:hypothetical protein